MNIMTQRDLTTDSWPHGPHSIIDQGQALVSFRLVSFYYRAASDSQWDQAYMLVPHFSLVSLIDYEHDVTLILVLPGEAEKSPCCLETFGCCAANWSRARLQSAGGYVVAYASALCL
jgi:hypothetical protein